MATIKHKGNPVTTIGELPKVGSAAPDFKLTKGDLSDVSLKDFAGKRKLIDITPSLDTGVCQTAARKFNEKASSLANTVVLIVSADLPFAQKRFCTAEGLTNVVPLSMMRSDDFGKAWGVLLTSGPMAGVLSRSVVILDENDKVTYTQQVGETTEEPDYDAAFKALA